MSTKTMKILTTIVTALLVVAMGASIVYGFTPADVTPTDVKGTDTVKKLGNQIVGLIQTIGIIASVIILMIIGIKYMMGSAEEKAEYKKTMIPYLIGAVILFAASFLSGSIYDFAINIGK